MDDGGYVDMSKYPELDRLDEMYKGLSKADQYIRSFRMKKFLNSKTNKPWIVEQDYVDRIITGSPIAYFVLSREETDFTNASRISNWENEDIYSFLFANILLNPNNEEYIINKINAYFVDDTNEKHFCDYLKEFLVNTSFMNGFFNEYKGEILFGLNYYLFRAGKRMIVYELESFTVETIFYDFSNFSTELQRKVIEYFSMLRNEEDILGLFIRKISCSFKDYESIFMMTKDELICDLLNISSTGKLPYRVLRSFYSSTDITREWNDTVKRNVKDDNVKNWCNWLYLYHRMNSDVSELTEYEFWEKWEPILAVESDYPFELDSYRKKTYYELSVLYNSFILKNWNVMKLIRKLQGNNACKPIDETSNNYLISSRDTEYKFCIQAASEMCKLYTDPSAIVYIYMNTHLKFYIPFRKIIEAISKMVGGEACVKLFEEYNFIGRIVQTSKNKSSRIGYYLIEPINVGYENGYNWNAIHSYAKKGIISETERRRRCSLMLNSDIDENSHIIETDSFVFFKLSRIKTDNDNYKDCTIYVNNITPRENGLCTAKIPTDVILDNIIDWLDNIKKTHVVQPLDDKYLMPRIYPSQSGRGKEFAILILETYIELMYDRDSFEKFYYMMNSSHYDEFNEFFYKPGLRFFGFKDGNPVLLSHQESEYVFFLVNKIVKANVLNSVKMKIYMSSVLKQVYFLERFVSSCGRNNIFLYDENYEYKYYAFPVKFIKEDDNSYIFAFYNGKLKSLSNDGLVFRNTICSKYWNKLYISKEKVDIPVEDLKQNNLRLHAEIHFIDWKSNRIALYQVIDTEKIKKDSWKQFYLLSYDYKCENEYNIQQFVNQQRLLNIDLNQGSRYEKFLNDCGNYFHYVNYSLEKSFYLIKAWDAGENYMCDGEYVLNHKTESVIDDIERQINNFIEKCTTDNYTIFLSIIKHSYISILWNIDEIFEQLSIKLSLTKKEIMENYNDDNYYIINCKMSFN